MCANLTFSRSGSLKAKASSLLSMTDAAATSRGVDPRIEGEAEEGGKDKERGGEEKGDHRREVKENVT